MKMYTVKELSKLWKIKENTIRVWIMRGKLDFIKVGNATRITQEAVDKFLKG